MIQLNTNIKIVTKNLKSTVQNCISQQLPSELQATILQIRLRVQRHVPMSPVAVYIAMDERTHYMRISGTEFHPSRTIITGTMDRNSLTSRSKA
jgi:hypothetical protein